MVNKMCNYQKDYTKGFLSITYDFDRKKLANEMLEFLIKK